jgi:hypothetical protein
MTDASAADKYGERNGFWLRMAAAAVFLAADRSFHLPEPRRWC